MTPNTKFARTAKKVSVAQVEQLLRNAAFVLKMTRRVKEEMLRDATTPKTETQAAERTGAALGV